jgi:dihydrofolate synthase/folylpolyglutamate synthase
VLTTVDLDHQEYLGNDRETIGADKAGIFRAGRPCVLGERDPPSSVLRRAYEIGAFAIRGHSDYLVERREDGWSWREPGFEIELPLPALVCAGAARQCRRRDRRPARAADRAAAARDRRRRALGARAGSPAGDCGSAEVLVDVAHNPQAAEQLAGWLRAHPKPTRAVFGALRDKDVDAVVAALDPLLLEWHLAGIHDAGARGGGRSCWPGAWRRAWKPGRLHLHHDAATALKAALAASSAR